MLRNCLLVALQVLWGSLRTRLWLRAVLSVFMWAAYLTLLLFFTIPVVLVQVHMGGGENGGLEIGAVAYLELLPYLWCWCRWGYGRGKGGD